MQTQFIVSQSNIPKEKVSRERKGDYLQAVAAAVVGRDRDEQRRLRELCVFCAPFFVAFFFFS
jgi:hypothetical protein